MNIKNHATTIYGRVMLRKDQMKCVLFAATINTVYNLTFFSTFLTQIIRLCGATFFAKEGRGEIINVNPLVVDIATYKLTKHLQGVW